MYKDFNGICVNFIYFVFCYSIKEFMWDKDMMMFIILIIDKIEGLKEEI